MPLKKPLGLFTVVDDADFALASSLALRYRLQLPPRQFAKIHPGMGYAQSGRVGLQRFILSAAGIEVLGLVVDHLDGWGLDNRRENLRAITTPANSRNRRMTFTQKSGGRPAAKSLAPDAFIPLEVRAELLKPVIEFLEQSVRDGLLRIRFRGAPLIEDQYRLSDSVMKDTQKTQ